MIIFVTILHLLLCVILILVILLQPGKGGDVASAFGAGGGGGNNVFGPRGPASLLSRATTVVAVLFMVTSITLAINSQDTSRGGDEELEDDFVLEEEEGFLPAFKETTPSGFSGDLSPDLGVMPGVAPAEREAEPEPEVPDQVIEGL